MGSWERDRGRIWIRIRIRMGKVGVGKGGADSAPHWVQEQKREPSGYSLPSPALRRLRGNNTLKVLSTCLPLRSAQPFLVAIRL